MSIIEMIKIKFFSSLCSFDSAMDLTSVISVLSFVVL